MMLERVLVFIALLGLYAFCGVVVAYVAEPDLVIVTLLVLALATHDFWISVFRPRDGIELESGPKLEARHTGVSGKPVTPVQDTDPDTTTIRSSSRDKKPKA